MITFRHGINRLLSSIVLTFALSASVTANSEKLDELYERLQADVLPEWQDIENQIVAEQSKSGSDAMDLLLQRGREALEAEEFLAAIEHFTALTDHAPDFAEGFNARATAYFAAELFGPSLADIERTLALDPRHYRAMIGLGTVLMTIGREEEALFAYRKAYEINPHREDVKGLIDRLAIIYDGIDL